MRTPVAAGIFHEHEISYAPLQQRIAPVYRSAKAVKLEEAMVAAEAKAAAEKKAKEEKLAALTPTETATDQRTLSDLPRLLQTELRRVGCYSGTVDSNWSGVAQKSLALFNKNTGLKLEVKVASIDALEIVRGKTDRVCPLVCEHGFKADGERCTKITCKSGYEVGDDNTCEKIEVRKPSAKREAPKRDTPERAKAGATPAQPQASGQIVCGQAGCRPVQKGCRLVANPNGSSLGRSTIEVCN